MKPLRASLCLALWLGAPALPALSAGLAPTNTHAVIETVADDYAVVAGTMVDVKIYRPAGLPLTTNAPVLLYTPGGGTGADGVIAHPPQHDALWRMLCGSGLTVIFLQNTTESSPGYNFWQLRGAIVLWGLTNFARFNADFGTQLGAASPAVVAGWSLGAATGVQHAGANFGDGDFTDPRILGCVLFASPALGAYGGKITSNGLARITRPVLCIFGTDDLGQPGTYTPGDPPATSPRGRAVAALLQGNAPLVVAACFQGANHFEYGSRAAPPGSYEDQRNRYINRLVWDFTDLLLRGLPDCGPFAGTAWIDPAHVAWSDQSCAVAPPPQLRLTPGPPGQWQLQITNLTRGLTYLVEGSPTVAPGSWTPLATNAPAPGSNTWQLEVTNSGAPTGFFRVRTGHPPPAALR